MDSLLDIFQFVKKDFCGLLDYKLRGQTLEIITGIPTITNAIVSVFVSYTKGKFAISDGGWIASGEYNHFEEEPEESEVIDRIIEQYKEYFSIKTTSRANGPVYYYRTTEDIKLVSAAVSDVGNFVANAVNTSHIAIRNQSEEAEQKQLFHNRINSYLRQIYGHSNVGVNDIVKLKEERQVRVNAVLNIKDNHRLRQYYIMYVTGQRSDHFIKDASKATLNFKIIDDYHVESSLFQRVAIINHKANGYDKTKSGLYLQQLSAVTDQEAVIDVDSNLEDILVKMPIASADHPTG